MENKMFLTEIFIFVACLVQLFDSSHSVDVQCDYETGNWAYVGSIYYCSVQNNPNINTRQSAIIDSASGSHQVGQNNDNVLCFRAVSKTINFFPRGLEKVFGDFKAIAITLCDLKEIRQSDLKPFTQLVHLNLVGNEIKVLEKGLFDFNPMLVMTDLHGNNIVHIDVDVFQHLNKLTSLFLNLNNCIDKYADNNDAQVKEVIKEAQQKCQDEDFLAVERNLKELEDNLTCSSAETSANFNTKFEKVQSQVSNPKLSDFYQERMQQLAASKDQKCSPQVEEEVQTSEKPQLDSKSEIMSCGCLSQQENGTLANLASKVQDIKDALDVASSTNSAAFETIKEKVDGQEMSMNAEISNLETSLTRKVDNLEKSINEIKASQELAVNSMNDKISSLEASIKNLEKLIRNHIGSI